MVVPGLRGRAEGRSVIGRRHLLGLIGKGAIAAPLLGPAILRAQPLAHRIGETFHRSVFVFNGQTWQATWRMTLKSNARDRTLSVSVRNTKLRRIR